MNTKFEIIIPNGIGVLRSVYDCGYLRVRATSGEQIAYRVTARA